MPWLKAGMKTVLLGAIAFALALGVSRTPAPGSYVLALAVSVALCPLALGLLGARVLRLGPAGTLIGAYFLPVLTALDARFHLGRPEPFGWLLASAAVTALGWRLGRVKERRETLPD